MEKQRKAQLIHHILKRTDGVKIVKISQKKIKLKVDFVYHLFLNHLEDNCIFSKSCSTFNTQWTGYLNWLNQNIIYDTKRPLW